MKNLVFTFCFLTCVTSYTYPQMIVDSIIVSNFTGGSRTLIFGLDTSATNGIDLHLGENWLPPFPPAGAFDARLFLPENNFSGSLSSWRDFRNMENIPFAGQKEFRIAWQLASGAPILRISWYFPPYLYGRLQDVINGTLVNVMMSDSGYTELSSLAVLGRLKMFIDYELPVELTSFTYSIEDDKIIFHWSTASEINNKGFEVERIQVSSLQPAVGNNEGWEVIGFVEGYATTTETHSYSFIDENISAEKMKYRLKQIDFDGTYTYSNEVEVVLAPKVFALEQNYPNPFNPNTMIQYTVGIRQFITLKVFDLLGREVATLIDEEKPAGSYEIELNAAEFSSGVYFYQLRAGEFNSTKKLILVK